MKPFDEELVSGSITRSVWKLAWPIVLLNLVNGLHGFVDHVLVGRLVSSADNAANAGVGMAWTIFMVIIVFVTSLYHGMNVLVARFAGMQDRSAIGIAAYNSFFASLLFMLIIAPLGYWASPLLLKLVHASNDEIKHALPYMRVLFTMGWPIFFLFMITGLMQSSGDTRIPLLLGIIATTLNILLSMILIIGLGPFPAMGVVGAAIATCLAPFVSVLIGIALMLNGRTIAAFPRGFSLKPDLSMLRAIARIGLPSGIQAVILNLAGVALLRYIGMLDERVAARAAYTIAYTQLFAFVTWPSLALRSASSAIMGQNIGAGHITRGIHGVYLATAFGIAWAAALGLLYWLFADTLLGMFGVEQASPTMAVGVTLLRFLAFSGVFLAAGFPFTGGLIGGGDTLSPMIIAVICQIGIMLGSCQFFASAGMLSIEHIWTAILLAHIARLILTYIVFYRGRWTRIKLDLGVEYPPE